MFFDGLARRAFGHGEGHVAAPALVPASRKLRIGLALGSGAARGWAHIGVLRALHEAGIRPDVIAGCSVGAVIGGCYAAGKLDELERFARLLSRRRVMGLLDFHMSGAGLIGGDRIAKLLDIDLGETRIEDLGLRFAAVATELSTGHEIWLTRGRLVDALRASYALPGVFDPVKLGGRWLMDGALVNPVPVTVARALGADIVICVNLNGDIKLRGTVIQNQDEVAPPANDHPVEPADRSARGFLAALRNGAMRRPARPTDAPSIGAVMIDAFNITQDRISRSRLAGDPPDVMITPKLQPVGLFEFHRAEECIARGHEATLRALADIRGIVGEAAYGAAHEAAAPQAVAM